jgi:hypothetical protein
MTIASMLSFFEQKAHQNIDFVFANYTREKSLRILNAAFDNILATFHQNK